MSAKPAPPERGDVHLDLRGLKCPLPALHTRKALTRLAPGTALVVTCTDPMAVIDIPHLAQETGAALEDKQIEPGLLTFRLRR
ncbi:sulfurtransferase TusA family protein [Aquabacter spiritensis]|uniref:tRNA 2-thiouridine synthesizing protein A n=1 Tax=Aquabacter spiritensis TaxID=933073 RepID=A0A4R3LKZ6_9HYPH|nr:sulfurtransferase TusA family protein [Aquabacter spiritensis]TCT00962.1 tRNA 2-thiouridine synthesizing protein A [Aquabacter spiritensis]